MTRIFRSILKAGPSLPCSRCKENKQVIYFRIRTYKETEGEYYSPVCKSCEAEVAREYYAAHKDNAEFKEKNRQRSREYLTKHIDEIRQKKKSPEYKKKKAEWELNRYYRKSDELKAKMKLKRQTDKYKKQMKAYRKKNKAKIYKQEVVTKKRYHEKNKNKLTDKYISRLLITQGLPVTPESIEIKRGQVLVSRIKEKIRKIKK